MSRLNLTFASLFRQCRLKSGFTTLSEFADALAQEGYVYEDSLFSHWQKGDRTPKDRGFLISILNIFVNRGGISRADEANSFLASVGQRDLSKQELALFSKNLSGEIMFTAPDESKYFIGREKYLKEVSWNLLNKKIVLIYGEAGVGKTYLAIKIAHSLRDKFRGGIFWYRFDLKDAENILNNIARVFGEDISRIKDKRVKSEIVRNLLTVKYSFLILDNVESFEDIHLFLPTAKQQYSILLTSKFFYKTEQRIKQIKLNDFNEKELLDLAKRILGLPFVLLNLEKIKKLGRLIGYSPLAAAILLKRIENAPNKLNTFLQHFEKKITDVYRVLYDNKTLFDSLNLSCKAQSNSEKNIFTSLGIFQGGDFSKEAVAYINKINPKESAVKLLNLQKSSLIEHSTYGRYRLHPIIKLFAQSKKISEALYGELASYYKISLAQFGRGTSVSYDFLEKEFDNIIGVFEKCYHLGFYKRIIELWEFIGIFLWDRGRWKSMKKYEKLIANACKKTDDKIMLALCYVREFSWLYFWQGDIKKAQLYVKKAIKISKMLQNHYLIAFAELRLGKIYQRNKLFNHSLKLLKSSLRYFKSKHNYEKQGDLMTYIGESYWFSGKNKQAKRYFLKAVEMVNKINDIGQKAIIFSKLGGLYLQEKKLAKAEFYFRRSIVLENNTARRVGGKVWNNVGLSFIKELKKEMKQAEEFMRLSKKEAKLLGFDQNWDKKSIYVQTMKKSLL